ncbi:Tkp1 protein [Vanderwaltozyma polyspora DSM 70294]|uniref:Tkp1 protein n=1 Tax=Vanderwaltozyma polyspora (strain ATCC 22028 / DSM 70294 / BCRC 21397 / CBS 2163 / NBRC 10782 / NRRL Y-8283 / UCD 57-17) TaxID=436907 RepID=A7TMQ1_VANPO|nr:Tkp1 protein [Vanderwaltozyma polyspora DSM 70294]EDO16465.1 Tkp1 protein [Vanderwaltozyma polyspora DSM 70294]
MIMLTRATSAHNFDRWITDFVKFLKQNKLEDLVPDKYGSAKRTPNNVDKAFILNTINMYVPENSYPDWMKSSISKRTNLLTLILHAVGAVANNDPEEELLNELHNITFDGSNAAFIFAAKIRSLFENCKTSKTDISESLVCKFIMKGLRGTYQTLNARYSLDGIKITLELLLRDIQIQYDIEKNGINLLIQGTNLHRILRSNL